MLNLTPDFLNLQIHLNLIMYLVVILGINKTNEKPNAHAVSLIEQGLNAKLSTQNI